MRFISKNRTENFNFFDFFDSSYKINKVYIASAYCDYQLIYDIKNYLIESELKSAQCEIKVYIDMWANNAFVGKLLSKNFRTLNTKLRNEISQNSGIFLVKNKGNLFHSKLLYIRDTQDNKRIYTGSMNFTYRGIEDEQNEEILVEVESNRHNINFVRSVEEYFEYLKKNSINVADTEPYGNREKNSIYTFFSSGSMYFEYSKTNLFNFKIGIPDEIRKRQSQLDDLLEDVTKDSINIVTDFILPKDDKKNRFQWKKYTIETPYGWFAPKELVDYINKVINEKYNNKDAFIADIIDKLYNKEFIDSLIIPYLTRLNQKCNEVLEKEGKDEWLLNTLLARWQNWYSLLCNKLNNETDEEEKKIILRFINGVCESPFPNIWDNIKVYDNFITNFMESLKLEIEKADVSKTNNIFANFIREKYRDITIHSFEDFSQIICDEKFNNKIDEYINSKKLMGV